MASSAKDISAPPAADQVIEHEGLRYRSIQEGLAFILVPEKAGEPSPKNGDKQAQQVFYNPIQQFNRDLTVLALRAYGKEELERRKDATKAKKNLIDRKRKRRDGDTQEKDAKRARPDETTVAVPQVAGAETAGTEDGNHFENGDAAPDAQVGGETLKSHVAEADETRPEEAKAPEDHKSERPKAGPKFTILDALSASGLRALRYASEIPFVTSVTANDLSKSAVKSIKLNVEHNKLADKVRVSQDDATAHMYSVVVEALRKSHDARNATKSEKYNVVDLDPYGTAAPFLDAAVQAVRDDGGLLCVTCTDSGVWASNGYPEKCYSLYGGVPVKAFFCHEAGIRLILHAIETSAARYGLAIEPLLSLSIDFYVRVFVRVTKSAATVKFQGGKNMIVYSCDNGCGAWETQLLMRNKKVPNKKGEGFFYKHVFAAGPTVDKTCCHCGSKMHVAGPMYAGRMHSAVFIEKVLAELADAPGEIYGTSERVRGMLQTALEELLPSREEVDEEQTAKATADEGDEAAPKTKQKLAAKADELAAVDPCPFYFHSPQLASALRAQCPKDDAIRGALIRLGYRVTRSHAKAGSIKTDAPWSTIWHVFREWVRQKAPVKLEQFKEGMAGYRLLGLDKRADGENQDVPVPTDDGVKGNGTVEVVFDERLGREAAKDGITRYPPNPRNNWGPMSRASRQ